MNITASTIIRDGMPYLEHALNSILPHCDAAVLVDTGSVDNSVEVMKDLCATHIGIRWRVLETLWLGFGPSRELAIPFWPDGWVMKFGHDEIYFTHRIKRFRTALEDHWHHSDYDYLYPCEITFEGSHVHSQYGMLPKPGMNTRSQLFRIENDKYRYSWNHMVTNDDLGKTDKKTGEFTFLGPLCGNTNTVKQDPKFTSFVLDDEEPDSCHWAKASHDRLEWKTKSYRELIPTWNEETMCETREEHRYDGPWPEVLYDIDGNLPSWLQADIDKFA